jgi:ectoine hydroxylase-related dioxygenase (phytanoyl-CoA dioxygenase family)
MSQQNTLIGIDTPYVLTDEQIARFRENGYIKLKNVLSKDVLEFYGQEITRLVFELNTNAEAMEKRSTYGKAFLQVMNLWQRSQIVEQFVKSKRLAQIATDLMEVSGVRIYHDQALYKEAGGGITPWHADQFYWPLATDRSVTAWIPLQATPLEMGPLSFCVKSQQLDLGRNLEISDESEAQIQQKVTLADFEVDQGAFDLGEISYHLGWTFHRAGPNTTDKARAVMTIIYIDAEMTLMRPKSKFQQGDWEQWCPGVQIGEVINSPLNPIVYRHE